MGQLIITPKEKINEYFESDALNQSSLKKLTGGIESYLSQNKEEKNLFYEEKGHFIIGSGVDTMLTGEEGQFEKEYYVSVLDKKPSDTEMSIINFVLADIIEISPEDTEIKELDKYPGSILKAIEEHSWQGNWKTDTRINKIIEVGSVYFEDLKKGIGKQVISSAEHKLITDIVFSLKSNKRTSKFFDRNKIKKTPGLTVYYQLPIYFYYKGVYCKAMLDVLVVMKDSNDKIISVQAFDLKTMHGSTFRFLSQMKTHRYDIQAAWYTEAILASPSSFELEGLIKEDMLKPFTFIVESNSFPGQPLLYELDKQVLDIGKNGKKDLFVKLPSREYDELVKQGIKGFDELVDTYNYQVENDWVEEKIITDNDGVLKIDWNGIIN